MSASVCARALLVASLWARFWIGLALALQFGFFIISVVVLLNLLIAMMSQTYTDVYAHAQQEYSMEKARLVKECEGFEKPSIRHCLKHCLPCWCMAFIVLHSLPLQTTKQKFLLFHSVPLSGSSIP